MAPARPAALLALACCAALLVGAAAQFGMPGMGGGGPPKPAAVREDVPFIKCQVCEALVKQAVRKAKEMRAELKPGKKLDEGELIEYLERMCDPDKPEGKWVTHYDMVEDKDRIRLVDQGQPSRCNSECATIARACALVSDDLDLSDLSEALFKGEGRASINNAACYDMSRACRAKPPPVPKTRKPGPAHTPMSAEEQQRDEMMAKMKAAGLGGQMYDRESLMEQVKGLQEDADDGEFDRVPLREAAAGGGGGVADAVADAAARAGEAVGEAVSQAKEAAASAVNRASSFLKGALGGLASGGGAAGGAGSDSEGEKPAAEL